MKTSRSWTPTYKISAPRQLHPLVVRRRQASPTPSIVACERAGIAIAVGLRPFDDSAGPRFNMKADMACPRSTAAPYAAHNALLVGAVHVELVRTETRDAPQKATRSVCGYVLVVPQKEHWATHDQAHADAPE